ncbi:MAG: ATP-binding protein, partial [Anaerolineales bacterium]|nr:ATP-binding protein [Anaerolineales bacterium]
MESEQIIRNQFPLHLAKLYEAVCLEPEPRLRVNKLVELYEAAISYLALVGLALYDYYDLSDERVDSDRCSLDRPSLGHWVALLRSLDACLFKARFPLLNPPLNQVLKSGPQWEAIQALANVLGSELPKKIRRSHLLENLVEFRNKKIGHGSLSVSDAKQTLGSLESGLVDWLAGLDVLQQWTLLYIDTVNWQGEHYIYSGTNLNLGTSLYPVNRKGAATLSPAQVYLNRPIESEGEELVPLYPFIAFDSDNFLPFVFSEISSSGIPMLRCPYKSDVPPLLLDVEAGRILGKSTGETSPPPPPARPEAKQSKTRKETTMIRSWYDIIPPHEDIRRGGFDEAIFAADLGDVADGRAPADYGDAYFFYKKTFLTKGLKNLLGRVHQTLSTGQGSSVVQIQTPFGGGKTHALVAIYHYLKDGKRVENLLPKELSVFSAQTAVVVGNHWNPLEGQTSDGITRKTFWGELAFQIGGPAGYEVFRENDRAGISPGKAMLRQLLAAHQPCILLFDEILEYINRALDVRGQTEVSLGTQTFSFFQELTEAVAAVPRCMLVVTLPSSYLEDFSDREEESLARLNKIFGRVESIETPVQGEEVYSVIRRRLFQVEHLKTAPMREIVHRYFQLYQEHRNDLPPKARELNYREKMEMAYPFHPDVIDILYEKWSTFPTFQRTRGVLRLLANIIEDLYQRESSIDLILPGDINLDKPAIRQEFLKHVGSEYEGLIGSDIAGHEAKAKLLDSANKPWRHLAQAISTVIFYHSFSADDSTKGINLPYIKLAVLRSDTIPALVTDILGKLSITLWYLNSRNDAYYFSRIPNLNRMILDKKELFNQSYESEFKSILQNELGNGFRSYLWPENGDGIPDNHDLKLVVLHPEDSGSQIPDWIERRGNSFREYKNTLFFVMADTGAFGKLRDDVKTVLALEDIKNEIKSGSSPLPEEKQSEVDSRMRHIKQDYSYNVRRMYHTLRIGERVV